LRPQSLAKSNRDHYLLSLAGLSESTPISGTSLAHLWANAIALMALSAAIRKRMISRSALSALGALIQESSA
jgi:hypothetical protein